ncbi:MAG: hypothetical protein HWD86_06640 [Kangiellaceae bacterium]|nr:hypothetical protein [Kangiellaceae bacterium]
MQAKLKNILLVTFLAATSFVSGQAFAAAQICQNVQYSAKDDTQLHILTFVEPELIQPAQPPKEKKDEKKKSEQSVSWFSWLTESHTMPSLHFIDFLELFGDKK